MKFALGLLLSAATLAAQTATDTPEAHIASAKAAAGSDYLNLFNFLCPATAGGARAGGAPRGATPAAQRGVARGARGAASTPDRSTWYAEPVKVFDNFYFVGQSEYAVWAVTTSEGIILMDAIYDYSVEEEVDGGLKKLGLDPSKVKYVIISHAHPDHYAGGKFLQDKYGAKVIMSAADWDVLDRATGAKPKRDMVGTDGQKLTLGDTTLTLYVTPGHTPGTISTLIPVKDGGKSHLVALWGGMGLNADRDSLEKYVASARRFRDIAKQAGADVILSNHTDWDQTKVNLPILAKRAPGSPNPYVVGNENVLRFMKLPEECATARLMRLN